MNFSGLRNSFFLTFMISALIDLTTVVTEVANTGGGDTSVIYLICQTLIFGFVLRSVFIGILYDIIVNKVDDAISQSQLFDSKTDLDVSNAKKPKNSAALPKRIVAAGSSSSNSRANIDDKLDQIVSPDGHFEGSPTKLPTFYSGFTVVVEAALQASKLEAAEKKNLSRCRNLLSNRNAVKLI